MFSRYCNPEPPQRYISDCLAIDCSEVIPVKKRKFRSTLLILLVLFLFVTIYQLITRSDVIAVGSWGLSFQEDGNAPTGTVSQSALDAYDAKYIGNTEKKEIALTFDAGYENGCTAQILDVLKKHNVPGAFFLVGNYLEQNPELVKRMADEGHIVGNHTYHHSDMSQISDLASFEKELTAVEELYKNITGAEMSNYYRPPQGVYSEENLKMAKELGYRTVFWSLAYVDWNNDSQPTADEAFSKLLPRIHNGAIILLHSTSQTNAEILDELLTKWEEMGYSFISLDDLYA